MLAKRADGLYAAGVGGVVMSLPRQVGKTFLVGNTILGLCLLKPDLLVLWTAHHTKTSMETMQAMKKMVDTEAIAPFIQRVRRANGNISIEFINGSRILFGAREQGFGRGFAQVNVEVFDEAQILSERALEDMIPAVNAAPNGLVIFLGTPPRPVDPAEAFMLFRRDALAGKSKDRLYVEFSAPRGSLPSDRKAWAAANPSFPHRTSSVAMERMRSLLGSDEAFLREGLGIWDEDAVDPHALPAKVWNACRVDDLAGFDRERTCFAVRFSADGSQVALGAAARVGNSRILVDGVRVEPAAAGTGWLLDFLLDSARFGEIAQIVVDGKAGAGYFVNQLRESGVRAPMILTPSVSDVVTAHGAFLAGLNDGLLLRADNPELERQGQTAVRRKIGNQGGFGWAAPSASDSVALLDAVTLAFWACQVTKRRPSGKGVVKDREKALIL